MHVTQLFSYPVKSFRGNALQSLSLDGFGPLWDRRFMLVDSTGKFISQRSYPKMADVQADFDGQSLVLACEGQFSLTVPIELFSKSQEVTVWGDQVSALSLLDSEANKALSDYIACDATLVHMPEASVRKVDPEFDKSQSKVGFADGFPLLLCSEESLSDLNSRLAEPVSMSRFRPNVVISGFEAFAESQFKKIRIGGVIFDLVKPCSRCSMITLDHNGAFSKEPLKTLASYRTNQFGACFGENMVHQSEGTIALGMAVELLE